MESIINFEDKENFTDNESVLEKNKLTAQNINDMKDAINKCNSDINAEVKHINVGDKVTYGDDPAEYDLGKMLFLNE